MSLPVWLPKGFEFLIGVPERHRGKWITVALQAWFDDSGGKGNGQWLVIGGLLGNTIALSDLTQQWDRFLRATHPGHIEYFKMDQALSLKGEFRHWNRQAADDKIRQMAALLERSDLVQISVAIDMQALAEVEADWNDAIKGKHPINQPYLLGVFYAAISALLEAEARESETPIEIVFDDHSFKQFVANEWDLLRIAFPKRLDRLVPPYPAFRDDRVFPLLQAADLVAGHIRLKMMGEEMPILHGMPVSEHSRICDWRDIQDTDIHLKAKAIAEFGLLAKDEDTPSVH